MSARLRAVADAQPASALRPLEIGTLPQPWDTIGRHVALPTLSHDDRARLDGFAHLNHFLAQAVVPRLMRRFEVEGKAANDRHEARAVMEQDPSYAAWSRLRRTSMEMRQLLVTGAVAAQGADVTAACTAAIAAANNLDLDPDFKTPAYLTDMHAHLMPGGYVTERGTDDATAGASYEVGLYATVPGRSGPHSDGAGRALAGWLAQHYGDFKPKRIFDLGCGAGLNTLPIARAFPDAEVIGIDAGAPMLRYGAARAAAMGVKNVRFVQANMESLPEDLGTADLIYTTIVLHETSHDAVRNVFRQCQERLNAGGLTLHVEQPPYADKPLFEQVMRDWDGRYNNEHFWTGLYELDLQAELVEAGFAKKTVFDGSVSAVPWASNARTPGRIEDYGRTGNWKVVGAVKTEAVKS